MSDIYQRFADMRQRYRSVQKAHKELIQDMLDLLESYDGSLALDEYDTNIMPSREWEKNRQEMVNRLRGTK